MDNNYIISIVSSTGSAIGGAYVALLDENGNLIPGGVYQSASNGTIEINEAPDSMSVQVSAAGYADQELTLNPGSSTITMVPGAGSMGGSTSSPIAAMLNAPGGVWNWCQQNPHLCLLWILVILIIVYLFIKRAKTP